MAGLLSKDITLKYKKDTDYVAIDNLQECPALGGSVNKIDTTCLHDDSKKSINGLKDYGELAFKFLYDNSSATSNYRVLRGLQDAGNPVDWQVVFPDNTTFEFSGEVSTEIDSAGVEVALTFTASIALSSDMTITHPTI